MDINNIQALIAQGLITDVASVDPNKAYVAVGVFQPGNRQSGAGNANAYKAYAISVTDLAGTAGMTTAQNGLTVLGGTTVELGGNLIHTTDININGYSMQFSNGVYPILFLDPGKQQVAIGGNNPNGMLDITAVGSGTVGLQLNTASTQDAKLHFRTNNAATARSQLYVENATQTLNVYTVNSDTIFWNGNGLAQVKTLTLFTDTTAKFESNIGIGATPVSNGRVQINNASFGKSSINLGGADYFGIAANTTGLSMLLGVNTGNNKQLWLADQDKLASNSTNPVLQFGLFGTSPSAINAIATDGSYLNLVLQANGGNLGIGTGVVAPTAKLHVQGIDATSGTHVLKVDNVATNLLSIANNGTAYFRSILDGTGSGIDNYAFTSTTGGVKTSIYSQTGSTSTYNYFTNNVLGTQVSEFLGYHKTSVKNRWSVESLTTGNLHLWIDGSNGYIGMGNVGFPAPFFAPTSQLHVKSTNGYNQLRLETSYTPTSSADVNGNIGDIAWDDSFIYTKVSTGWKRASLIAF